MNMKSLLRPRVWLPTLAGVLIASVLYIIGENDDAPGLVLIGFISAISLLFYGIYNAASCAAKGLIPAILCFSLSLFGVIWTITLGIEGEFNDSPGISILAGLICLGFAIVGVRLLKNGRKKQK